MAKIKVLLHIEETETPQQAIEVARELIAMLKIRLNRTPHTVEGKVQIPFPDCGENLTVRDKEIVCLNCEANDEALWHWEMFVKDAIKGRHNHYEPEQTLESLLM